MRFATFSGRDELKELFAALPLREGDVVGGLALVGNLDDRGSGEVLLGQAIGVAAL